MQFVIWFIGKSSAGKTVIGEELYHRLKEKLSIIYLDGDELRQAISWDLGHSCEDREISEKRRSGLSKLISDQNISVICSGISNSPEIREWNKLNINNYLEIYIDVDQKTLYKRDPKGLYESYNKNKINNIVGEDIPFNEPQNPWLTIKNNGDESINKIVNHIILKLETDKFI